MRRRFEYSAQDIFGDSPQVDMLQTLRVFGAEGWELITSVPITRKAWATNSGTVDGQRLLFKREVWEQ